MTADYVRDQYGVDYKRGDRLLVDGRPGTLVSFPGQYLGVRFDDELRTCRCHPTWRVTRFTDRPQDDFADHYGHLPIHDEYVEVILRDYVTGDDRTWDEERSDLDITDLLAQVRHDGRILHPVTLGSDGRVLDGHHRVLVADELGLGTIPVRRATLR